MSSNHYKTISPLVMFITWLYFGKLPLTLDISFPATLFSFTIFFQSYQIKLPVSHISQITCSIYALHKGNALVGWTMLLWPHPSWLRIFLSQISNSSISWIVGQSDVKHKRSEAVRYWVLHYLALWPHPWTWPLCFKLNFVITLSQW